MDSSEALKKMTEEKAAATRTDEKRAAEQKAGGRLTARERIRGLFDEASFVEFDAFKRCGVVTGFGTVQGRPAYCFAQDVTDRGGAMCVKQGEKILNILTKARTTGAPVIMLLDSNGLLLEEGAAALNAYADVMSALSRLSGVCPLIACVMGSCRGIAAMMARIADITVQVKNSTLALSSLLVMQKGADKDKNEQALFGADTMAAQGTVALKAESEAEAFGQIGELLALLPSCNMECTSVEDEDDLNREIPDAASLSGKALAEALADCGRGIELNASFGAVSHTLLCRLGGRTCGIISQDGGKMGVADMEKAARFIRFCDCYQLPVITLCNTDGIEPPSCDTQGETIRAAAQLLYAYAEATCVKLSVVCGSAIGNAYAVMGGGSMADVSYVWPAARIAAVSAASYEKTIGKADYDERFGAMNTARQGLADDCVDPKDTRKLLINAMELMATKHDVNLPRKHDNMPL